MKPRILYAIQGTGNGHLVRALDIVPLLQARAGQLDLLISGPPSDMPFPFPVRYRCQGLSYVMDREGGISFRQTYQQLNLPTLAREIRQLPVRDYDLVISDFEPVSSWACRLRRVPCIGLSHQSAVVNPQSPRPLRGDWVSRLVLEHWAPASVRYGFHFQRYAPGVFTPVIRQPVRAVRPTNEGHYTVYLPAFAEEVLVRCLQQVSRDVRWEVFSKFSQHATTRGNVHVQPISADAFLSSLARSAGVLCGAGFETPAEALFLGKKLLVIPMRNQYEQACNAAALARMGVPVASSLRGTNVDLVRQWLHQDQPVPVDYPDETAAILDQVLRECAVGR